MLCLYRDFWICWKKKKEETYCIIRYFKFCKIWHLVLIATQRYSKLWRSLYRNVIWIWKCLKNKRKKLTVYHLIIFTNYPSYWTWKNLRKICMKKFKIIETCYQLFSPSYVQKKSIVPYLIYKNFLRCNMLLKTILEIWIKIDKFYRKTMQDFITKMIYWNQNL